ncbi:hypothetical protein AB1Y20_023402 [Prymnesium parvum]|uniref:BED-type domain-containing protein n=1 Tax=Prymnesium parvum TaxID=97485 RepID=A0AB34JG58_PRYPA
MSTPPPAPAPGPTPRATLGLEQPPAARVGSVRKAPVRPPARSGKVWKTVKVVKVLKDHATSPHVECLHCEAAFCGGATRIKEHILNKCACESDAFCVLKMELLKEAATEDKQTKQKTAQKEVIELVACEEKMAKEPNSAHQD